jgi:hypothetical protein
MLIVKENLSILLFLKRFMIDSAYPYAEEKKFHTELKRASWT